MLGLTFTTCFAFSSPYAVPNRCVLAEPYPSQDLAVKHPMGHDYFAEVAFLSYFILSCHCSSCQKVGVAGKSYMNSLVRTVQCMLQHLNVTSFMSDFIYKIGNNSLMAWCFTGCKGKQVLQKVRSVCLQRCLLLVMQSTGLVQGFKSYSCYWLTLASSLTLTHLAFPVLSMRTVCSLEKHFCCCAPNAEKALNVVTEVQQASQQSNASWKWFWLRPGASCALLLTPSSNASDTHSDAPLRYSV